MAFWIRGQHCKQALGVHEGVMKETDSKLTLPWAVSAPFPE